MQGFENMVKIMCKSGLPTNIPIESLRDDERFHRHEMDIRDGAVLLEEDGRLADFDKVYDLSLQEIQDLLKKEAVGLVAA